MKADNRGLGGLAIQGNILWTERKMSKEELAISNDMRAVRHVIYAKDGPHIAAWERIEDRILALGKKARGR